MFSDEKQSTEITDQPTYEAAAKKPRARLKKTDTTRSQKMARPVKEQAPRRGPGRPKGSKNKLTLEREKLQKALDRQKIGPIKIKVIREPKDILLESANYFWARAEFLSNHARKLANEDATSAAIDAIMEEVDRQLNFACKCAEQAAPYYHARVSGRPVASEVVAYVARLPSPVEDSAKWAAECQPQASGWKKPQ